MLGRPHHRARVLLTESQQDVVVSVPDRPLAVRMDLRSICFVAWPDLTSP